MKKFWKKWGKQPEPEREIYYKITIRYKNQVHETLECLCYPQIIGDFVAFTLKEPREVKLIRSDNIQEITSKKI